jgi:hypothetical protein
MRTAEPRPARRLVGSELGAKPKVCLCKAYRWPHRHTGGLCRWPDPPKATCPRPPGINQPSNLTVC